ncbi:MAG: C4-dicarboxylate transporter DcuC [Burkholderiaceae bacterium]|nr:C4-dicarboxylate transporter DcuC [Burkholderiaceae bacterium]
MIWLGLLIVVVTFWFIIKNYETRMVLFLSGVLMATISGELIPAINAFIKQFNNVGLVNTICTVLGFSYVMSYTKCADHLIAVVTGVLKHCRFVIVPAAMIVTFCLNIALPSAAGVSAAVGTLLIPLLLAMRVTPAMAGSAVFLGTWGSVLSPGLMFNPMIAEMAQTDVMSVIISIAPSVMVGMLVAVGMLTLICFVLKEGAGSYQGELNVQLPEGLKVNYLYAMVPVLPLVLLVISSEQVAWIPYVSVPQAMICGTVVGLVLTRKSPGEGSKKFFRGAGDGFCDVVGLMAAAATFCAGMQSIGLTDAMIDMMKESKSIAQVAAAAGPFTMAMVSGSGNAAGVAFIGSVVPHAEEFGYTIIELGGMAEIAGAIGRSMSPVAAGAVICAKLAGVNPMELAKRNALPTILATIVMAWLLL